MTKYIFISLVSITLWSCGSGTSDGFSNEEPKELTTAPAKVITPINENDTIFIQALGANMSSMRFDIKTLKVPANKEITVVLENAGTDPIMPHNIVFIQEGTANDVGQAGIKFKENAYVNPEDENVIASSPIAQMGEKVYFSFTTPDAGDYEFICSYPGHWGKMKGKFVTE